MASAARPVLLVLLAWIPLRQWPGFGTLANGVGDTVGLGTVAHALLIGATTQFFLRWTVVDPADGTASESTGNG